MPEFAPPPWLVWALLSAVFAAMTAIFAKVGVAGVDSDLATFVRTVVILVLVFGIAWSRDALRFLPELSPRTYGALLLSGLATGVSWLCYFKALQAGDAARVAPVDKMSVVLVAVLSVLFLGEHLSLPNWMGVCLILAGVVLVAV